MRFAKFASFHCKASSVKGFCAARLSKCLEDRGKVVQNQGNFPMALAVNTTIGSQGLPVEFLRFVELAKAIKDGRQRDPVGSNSNAISRQLFSRGNAKIFARNARLN